MWAFSIGTKNRRFFSSIGLSTNGNLVPSVEADLTKRRILYLYPKINGGVCYGEYLCLDRISIQNSKTTLTIIKRNRGNAAPLGPYCSEGSNLNTKRT